MFPISRRSPLSQSGLLATSDMISRRKSWISTVTTWADDHFIYYRHDHGRGVPVVFSLNYRSSHARGTAWSQQARLEPRFLFVFEPIRGWAKARLHLSSYHPPASCVTRPGRRCWPCASPSRHLPAAPLMLSPHPSRSKYTIAQATPPRGPPPCSPASSRRAAAERRTPSRGPWRR